MSGNERRTQFVEEKLILLCEEGEMDEARAYIRENMLPGEIGKLRAAAVRLSELCEDTLQWFESGVGDGE